MTNGSSQGLFTIVYVVIFGIFVLISYILFRDTMKSSLSNIFSDSLQQTTDNMNGTSSLELKGEEEDGVIYVKIRNLYKKDGVNYSDIWGKFVVTSDNEVKLTNVGTTKSEADTGQGSSQMKGFLVLPNTVNGKTLTNVDQYSLEFANFDDTIVLNKDLKEIGKSAFSHSKFTGKLTFPEGITYLGAYAFQLSEFTGSFNTPEGLTQINEYTFQESKFTGDFNVNNVKNILSNAFENSKFNGRFINDKDSNLEVISDNTFTKAQFNGGFVVSNKLRYIGIDSFTNSIFSGTFDTTNANALESICENSFSNSTFTGELILPDTTIFVGKNSLINSKFNKVTTNNVDIAIHKDSIKLANGNFY